MTIMTIMTISWTPGPGAHDPYDRERTHQLVVSWWLLVVARRRAVILMRHNDVYHPYAPHCRLYLGLG